MAKRYNESYEKKVVNISTAEILTMGTTPIQILPGLPAGSYYDWNKLTIKYIYGGTAFTLSAPYMYLVQATGIAYIDSNLLKRTFNDLVITRIPQPVLIDDTGFGVTYTVTVNGGSPSGSGFPVNLRLSDSVNPTLGNGTLELTIEYKVATF